MAGPDSQWTKPPPSRALPILGILLVLALLIGAAYAYSLWSANQTAKTLSEIGALISLPPASPETLTFSGNADTNTAPFQLTGDTYVSNWTKAPGCSFGAYLESPTDNLFGRALGSSYSDGPTSGQTYAYHVGGPGTFYLQVQGSCPWKLTLTAG